MKRVQRILQNVFEGFVFVVGIAYNDQSKLNNLNNNKNNQLYGLFEDLFAVVAEKILTLHLYYCTLINLHLIKISSDTLIITNFVKRVAEEKFENFEIVTRKISLFRVIITVKHEVLE